MPVVTKEKLEIAQKLMDDFALRTGLSGNRGNIKERYLWTDAFAVHTFFALAHVFGTGYRKLALQLIKEVHQALGRFPPADIRKGWISGLAEEEGQRHPTAGGLRIGKKMTERKYNEAFNERLEWERDGQYFHYLTRWIQALLEAEKETNEKHYALWAAELLEAGNKFIYKIENSIRMYWKMSTDLSRPLIQTMGAHDPLEGLVCSASILEKLPEKTAMLQPIVQDLKDCSRGLDWSTTDPLGIGGLLLNIARLSELNKRNVALPENIRPEKLLADSLYGLEVYVQMHELNQSARQRLAFRECGLSLGLRVLMRLKEKGVNIDLNLDQLAHFIYLADDIETFWINPKNQLSPTWNDHLNINTVSLAASLVAA